MRRHAWIIAGCWGAWLGATVLVSAQTPVASMFLVPQAASPRDQIELNDGRRLQGFIESEDELWIYLVQIEQPPGRPMYGVIRMVDRAKVKSVVRLEPAARTELARQVEQFINRAQIEAGAMESVPIATALRDGVARHVYRGKWFSLESTVDEPTTRRLIVRMEQVFTAYRQLLSPRVPPRKPLRVLVHGSLDSYRAELRELGLEAIGNRAVFLPEPNLVIAGSEMTRVGAEVEKVKADHDKLQAELDQYRKDLPSRLEKVAEQLRRQGKPSGEIKTVLNTEKRKAEALIKQKELDIKLFERRNEKTFDTVARQALRRLYHEAFHAYLENYVYRRDQHPVPLWLDEGLAMIFEEGLLESGMLRVDAPHRAALKKLKADLAGPQPLTVEQVLSARQEDFVISEHNPAETSNRYYWYAWGLAYYLTFEGRLLAEASLDRYVAPEAKATPPVERFERLVGMPLARFETVWQKYLRTLR